MLQPMYALVLALALVGAGAALLGCPPSSTEAFPQEGGKRAVGRDGHLLTAQYDVRRRTDSDGIRRVSQKYRDETAGRHAWVRLT